MYVCIWKFKLKCSEKKTFERKNPRGKRQIVLSPAMVAELNEEDEKGNAAIEEVNINLFAKIITKKYIRNKKIVKIGRASNQTNLLIIILL